MDGHVDQYNGDGKHQINHGIPQNDIEILLIDEP